LTVTDQQNKKERIDMKSKTKNNKVPKSAKTRLSDLTPKKEARGAKYMTPPGGVANAGAATPPYVTPPLATPKKHLTL
jgi:hypothetical protein